VTPPHNEGPLTVGRALQLGTERLKREGIDSARLDMSLLIGETLGIDRLGIYTSLERPLDPAERARARELLARRLRREPVAYILGRREFYGLEFDVAPGVLIPRPETELVVEIALNWLKAREDDAPTCVDVGTGSGAVAVTLAHEAPATRWIATDISEAALTIARANAAKLLDSPERIDFRLGSLLEPIAEPVDLIVSNPPYVAEGDRAGLAPEVRDWEPAGALFAGERGLDILRDLIEAVPASLRPGGLFACECGTGQTAQLCAWLHATDAFESIRSHNDLAGHDRAVSAQRLTA
jgi:release factor glutamine methyltransferase